MTSEFGWPPCTLFPGVADGFPEPFRNESSGHRSMRRRTGIRAPRGALRGGPQSHCADNAREPNACARGFMGPARPGLISGDFAGDIEGAARGAQSVSLASSWPVARVVPPGRKRSRPGRSAPRHRGRRRLTDGGELTRRPVRSVGGVAGADRRCGSRRCRRPPAGSAPSPPAHRPSTGRRQSAASRGRRTAEPFIYQATA